MNLHDSLIWRADTDKAHRCPCRMLGSCDCRNGYVSTEETDWHFRLLHVYRCGTCGIRVTRFPGWPHFPGTEIYWERFTWFWGRGMRYKLDNLGWWLRMKWKKLGRLGSALFRKPGRRNGPHPFMGCGPFRMPSG